jgi:hypothetical protein
VLDSFVVAHDFPIRRKALIVNLRLISACSIVGPCP